MDSKSTSIINWIFFLLLWGTIALGIILRMVVLIQNRSIFIDEANLARNLAMKSYLDFFQPLDFDQFAPPFFLCIEKVFATIYGMNEVGLRIFPLLCGIGTIIVFYQLLQKRIPYTAFQWYPLALLCCSPLFIRYSTEIKQYSLDAFLATLLLYLIINEGTIQNWSRAFFWAILGSFCICLSMPIVFILASIGLYLLLKIIASKSLKDLPFVLFIGTSWLISFGIYNLIGGVTWVLIFTLGGYLLGDQPWFKDNFGTFFTIIMLLTLVPFVLGAIKSLRGEPQNNANK